MAASFVESARPCAGASRTSLHVVLRTALSSRCSAHSHFPDEETGAEELCGSLTVTELDPGFKHRSADSSVSANHGMEVIPCFHRLLCNQGGLGIHALANLACEHSNVYLAIIKQD